MSLLQITIDNQIRLHRPSNLLSKHLKAALSFNNPAYMDAVTFGRTTYGIPKKIRMYEELNGVFCIPRGSWDVLSRILNSLCIKIKVVDKTVSFERQDTPKSINLWDYQGPWVDGMLSAVQGIGVGPPGMGKTACALAIYSKIGQPCLWLTHTERLAQQAAASAKKFLGIEAGIIGGGKEKLAHFTVGMIPTLTKKSDEKLAEYSKLFGTVIGDEIHHVPAKSSFRVLTSFAAKHIYGVTATPYREDKLERLIFGAIGPQLAYIDKETLRGMGKLMTPTVIRKHTDFYFPYNPSSKKFNYIKLVDAIAQDYKRNQQIVTDVIVESTLDDKNVCIILVGRIPHGEVLAEMLKPIIPDTGLVHSKLKKKEVTEVLDNFGEGKLRILIATYKMLAEGFDYQPTNRLFLTAPFKGRSLIEQACGRIERTFPGKLDAIVYDYVDSRVGVLTRQSETRLDIYEMNNNPVRTIK